MSRDFDYKKYWEQTYQSGGTSGAGSYGALAEFKAEVINGLIQSENLTRVIEFGCGDGNQLQYMKYQEYLGLDISAASVKLCARKFAADSSKSFMLYTPGLWVNRGFLQGDLTVCLDVLYHITDEGDFRHTLHDILQSSTDWVVLYTRLKVSETSSVVTIQDRDLFHYLPNYPEFSVHTTIPQRHPDLSSADFIILKRTPSINK